MAKLNDIFGCFSIISFKINDMLKCKYLVEIRFDLNADVKA